MDVGGQSGAPGSRAFGAGDVHAPDAEGASLRARLTIINADDWGYDAESTDRALECLLANRITSMSAVVHMSDSRRAARVAVERSVGPIGLHLNITEPYADVSVPASVRERQSRIAGYFSSRRLQRWAYNPRLHKAIRDVVQDQLAAFHEAYGRAPDHLDGHHHAHLYPNVLLDGGIPAGLPVRPSFTFLPGQKAPLNRAVRRAINGLLGRSHPATDYFFDIAHFRDLAYVKDLSRSTVELMAHPARPHDRELLMSDAWRRLSEAWTLGSYSEL